MPATHKPLARQSIVVTGASSGIGLATARKAAKAGAAVLLVARDETALKAAADEIRRAGGRAEVCPADVSSEDEVNRVVDAAAHLLGGFDTWVNDAGVGLYGDLQDLPTDEHRRMFDVNYWSQVYGSKAAVRYWKAHARMGALINVGSVLSDVPVPVLGAYAASKHAVRGFTHSLRLELARDKTPISVTLIKPASIATPFARNALNRTGGGATEPPPLYAPEVVADAILSAAVHPRREIIVGGSGVAQIMLAYHLPGLFEGLAARMSEAFAPKGRPDRSRSSLDRPGAGGHAHGEAHGRPFSLYTTLRTRPGAAAALALTLVAGGAIAAALLQPEARRYVEAEAAHAGRRARKEAKRLRKRSRKLVRDVRRTGPELQRRAAALARSVPHELPPQLGRRIARGAERTRASLQEVLGGR
ncbi:MAG: SDR family NAD(P)-dependent oxidoreductase [Caulobacteraceae bacterium]|nr:SDR family NAD(P)-dependent oxidoreductase [Caulobacter sp.]